MSMERIQCTSVTDTLIQAMDRAAGMDSVLVIYYAKDGEGGCFLADENMKSSDMLWLIEQFKAWLLGLAKREEKNV